MSIKKQRVIVVGARRQRQGIGEFIAKAFHLAGTDVAGVVGTSPETARQAQANLAEQYGIQCIPYDSLASALKKESPDIVAICSPIDSHLQHLELVSESGAHCLCEKPMVWGLGDRNVPETRRIVDRFAESNRYLSLVTQWPCTLKYFFQLYPECEMQRVKSFAMHLSPIRPGPDMILDAAPHLISMLQVLAGPGRVISPVSEFSGSQHLAVTFGYEYADGSVDVKFTTTVCEEIPRPASYSINGHELSREILLPQYEIRFTGKETSMPVEDPLETLVRDFVSSAGNNTAIDRAGLVSGIEALDVLYKSAEANKSS